MILGFLFAHVHTWGPKTSAFYHFLNSRILFLPAISSDRMIPGPAIATTFEVYQFNSIMKSIIISILILSITLSGFAKSSPKVPCDCETNQSIQLAYYNKGDFIGLLTSKNDLRLQLIKDRRAIMEYYAGHPAVYTRKKAKIASSIKELRLIERQLTSLSKKIKSAKVTDAKALNDWLHQIQGRSGLVLKRSSDILFGTYHGDEIPPFQIIKPGGGTNCEEGETPPNFDCGGVAQGVNNACLDGIQAKMECGYYASLGDQAQAQLYQDQSDCTTAKENSRSACQRAVESCDNTYDPDRDTFDFMRRAFFACSLKDALDEIPQTQTNNGN